MHNIATLCLTHGHDDIVSGVAGSLNLGVCQKLNHLRCNKCDVWKVKTKDLDVHVVVFKIGIVHEDVGAERVKAESRRRGVGVEEGSSEKLST